ncbi:MAG: sodium-dependent transporter, partial [Desulfovibrio sp.]|nr:sodium-dependent transporter [Desulfovibrio sp.]
NLLDALQPFGPGSTVLDLEDFLISNNILPLGGLVFLLFCCTRRGWGWRNFSAEANAGSGIPMPECLRGYLTVVLPCLILLLFLAGYAEKFSLF